MEDFSHISNQITKDEVVSKLKDDGDFDRLRLKISRKLKEDEKLRENLKAIVQQSRALNSLGSDNLKPRQLSDAIYQEIGDQLTGQVSDGLWEIIRSSEDMNGEIVETVQSVFNKMMTAKGFSIPMISQNSAEADHTVNGNEPEAPPGFSLPLSQNNVSDSKRSADDLKQGSSSISHDDMKIDVVEAKNKNSGSVSDEDPDLPPGFC